MDTSKLKEGMTVKNYKEMCKILGEEEKRGGARYTQEKKWIRHFDFTKNKYAFTINKIYDEPILPEYRKGTVYTKLIESILVSYLANQGEEVISLTYTEMYELLGMVSTQYILMNRVKNEALKYRAIDYDVNLNSLYDFKMISRSKLFTILKRALDNMQDKRYLIKYDFEYVIKQNDEYRVANEDEDRTIRAIHREVLNEMGMKDITAVYLKYEQENYYNKVNSRLLEEYQWDFIFKQIKISCTPTLIKKAVSQLNDDFLEEAQKNKIKLDKAQLNQAVQDAIMKVAKGNISKRDDLQSLYWGGPDKMSKEGRTLIAMRCYNNDTYIADMEKLTNKFISIK